MKKYWQERWAGIKSAAEQHVLTQNIRDAMVAMYVQGREDEREEQKRAPEKRIPSSWDRAMGSTYLQKYMKMIFKADSDCISTDTYIKS